MYLTTLSIALDVPYNIIDRIGCTLLHYRLASFTSIYQNVREGLYYLETVFTKFVPVGKGPVFYGFHGNPAN